MPGNLLPDDLPNIARRLGIDIPELFKRFLIVKIFWADKNTLPSFGFSPVVADTKGIRFPSNIITPSYLSACKSGKYACAFLTEADSERYKCAIHDVKPHGCSMLQCRKMTKSDNVRRTNAYYAEAWREGGEIFDVLFPKLRKTLAKLEKKEITEETVSTFFSKKISPIFLNKKYQPLSFFAK